MRTLAGHHSDISSLVELRNGYLVSGSWDHIVKLWDHTNGKLVRTIITGHTGDVSSLVELKNTGYLVSGGGYGDGAIKIWETTKGRDIKIIKAHSDRVTGLVELKNGWLASSSEDMTIKLWNTTNGQLINTLKEHTKWVILLKSLFDFEL